MPSRFKRSLLDNIRNDLQDFLGALADTLIVLRDRLPNRRMMRLSSNTPVNHLLTSFLRPMLSLELQPPCPNISEIAILCQSATEPLSGFLDLAFGPEDPRDGADHQRIIFRFSEGIR